MPSKNLQRVAEGGTNFHVYNKGIENKTIFADDTDYQVFIGYLEDYLSAPKAHGATKKEFTVNGRVFSGVPHQPKNYFGKVELIAYSLKPNQFHLVLHQKTAKSLQAFIRSLCTRYSIYFNKKYNRNGTLFEGPYKSTQAKDDKSLLLLTSSLHKAGGYSSYPEYLGQKKTPWVKSNVVLSLINNKSNYKDYIEKFEPGQDEKSLLSEITTKDAHDHLERRDLEQIHLKPWARIPELAAASAVFVLLLGIGYRNISATNKNQGSENIILGTKTNSTLQKPTISPNPSPIYTPTPEATTEAQPINTGETIN